MRNVKKQKCPRCKSMRLGKRLGGDNFCHKCGQRWTARGMMVHSFDKRHLKKGVEVPEDKQMRLC